MYVCIYTICMSVHIYISLCPYMYKYVWCVCVCASPYRYMNRYTSMCVWVCVGVSAQWYPLSMGFSRQEYWSGVLLQGMFPTQGWNPYLLHLLHWQMDSLPPYLLRSPYIHI